MFYVNINTILDDRNYQERYNELSNIPTDANVCVIDLSEAERLWPLDGNYRYKVYKERNESRSVLFDLHEIFKNHKGKIYYISNDCNIYERFEKWCLIDPQKHIDVYCYPFSDIPKIKILDDFEYDYETLIDGEWTPKNKHLKHKNAKELYKSNLSNKKTKNFITLVSAPRLIRLLFLDEFFNHDRMEFSLYPFYHSETVNNLITYSDYGIKTPYEWCTDGNLLKTTDEKYIRLDHTHFNPKHFPLKNGLNIEEHVRQLEEFPINMKYDKDIFNTSLPIATFNTCCDIVLETYCCNNSVFFTEKTWKEVIFRRPFISFGAVNQNKIFKKLGFRLYDEIFDYDFETSKNLNVRFDDFKTQIRQFLDIDTDNFEECMSKLQDDIDYNYDLYIKSLRDTRKSMLLDYMKTLTYKDAYVEHMPDWIENAIPELERLKDILK